MTSLREFLANDPLGSTDFELRRRAGLEYFSAFLPPDVDAVWPCVLARFVQSAPWRYWDPDTVDRTLQVLESRPVRTIEAMASWSAQVGIGFENLFRRSPTADYEDSLNSDKTGDLLRLATLFHPEYLRLSEQVFANIMILYGAVLKEGPVYSSGFRFGAALNRIESLGHNFLFSGYDKNVRDPIAHGNVRFKGGSTIQYGSEADNYALSTFEFLSTFDKLWRTTNALAIAILLFFARDKSRLAGGGQSNLPTSIIALLAAASSDRDGFSVVGAVESELATTGKQLHLAVETVFRSRLVALWDVARVAMHLLDNGASGYSRYLFELDQGGTVSSLVIISPGKLGHLLEEGAGVERLGEIIMDTPLLWYDESRLSRRIKVWKGLLRSNLGFAREKIHSDWHRTGFQPAAGRYRIRQVKNASAGTVARVRVIAVLTKPSDAEDKTLVREIIRAIILAVSKRRIHPDPSGLLRRWTWSRRPAYVWVSLYRLDGTVRWLEGGGWHSGNLVAQAEKAYGFMRPAIFVRNPEEVWRGIRLQYSMKGGGSVQAD